MAATLLRDHARADARAHPSRAGFDVFQIEGELRLPLKLAADLKQKNIEASSAVVPDLLLRGKQKEYLIIECKAALFGPGDGGPQRQARALLLQTPDVMTEGLSLQGGAIARTHLLYLTAHDPRHDQITALATLDQELRALTAAELVGRRTKDLRSRRKEGSAMFTRWIVALMLIPAGYLAAETDRRAIPPVIAAAASSSPAWVSESVAKDDSGALRRDVLSESEARSLRRAINRRKAVASDSSQIEITCSVSRGRVIEQFGARETLRDLADHSHSIFSGRIVGSEQGFLYAQPGTLFAVTISAVRKGPYDRDALVYLFYPYARMRVEGGLLCANPIGNVVVPRVGDDVVAFPFLPPVAGGATVFVLEPRWQLIVVRDGRTHLPENLTDELNETDSADSILSNVQRFVARDETGSGTRR